MLLPNVENAIITEKKLIEYLLSLSHPSGRSKARFFLSIGFKREKYILLCETLLTHARVNEIKSKKSTAFWTKYIIEGDFSAPDGNEYKLISVWIIENQSEIPYLVTAYPSKLRV